MAQALAGFCDAGTKNLENPLIKVNSHIPSARI